MLSELSFGPNCKGKPLFTHIFDIMSKEVILLEIVKGIMKDSIYGDVAEILVLAKILLLDKLTFYAVIPAAIAV